MDDVLLRVENWLLRSGNRTLALLALAYLTAIGSIVSFVFLGERAGTPTRLEIGLIVVATWVLMYLGFRTKRR